MKKLVVEAYNELMKVNVSGADVEHMYNALVRLAAVINAPETNAPEMSAPEAEEGEQDEQEVD